ILVFVLPVRPSRGPHSPNYLFVVAPGVGIKRRVSDIPHGASPKLIGSGPCDDLHLAVAAAQFGVDGSENDAKFADHIWIDQRRRTHAIRVPAFLHTEAVSHRVYGAGADPRKGSRNTEALAANSGHGFHQIEDIGAHQRKIADLLFR